MALEQVGWRVEFGRFNESGPRRAPSAAGAVALVQGRKSARTVLLVSNAVKHHGASNGKIWIYSAQTPQCVSLFVEDDGPGIDPQHHERVFQLMTTLRSRDECEGSGVGLALVSKIMRTLDGQVAIVTPRKLGGTCIAMHFGPACSSKKAA